MFLQEALVASLYYMKKDWNDLRVYFNSFENSDFVQSRNGMRWRSHPEASLSNFLYARGIKHKKGKKYPDDFKNFGHLSYAYYDLHFLSKESKWIDVEIWGDKPNGHGKKEYAKKRRLKEEYNKNNKYFLGVEYTDCYSEEKLEKILIPYIGKIKPFIFDKPTDSKIYSTHWSNADELINYCKDFVKKCPNGIFPTEEWLRKRGKWKNRKGPAYNTLAVYIKKWTGGIRKLREILCQPENSTMQWNKEEAIKQYKEWFDKHGYTPGQARRHKDFFGEEETRKAVNICRAVEKYAGGAVAVNKFLGIKQQLLSKSKIKFNTDLYSLK